MKVTKAQKIGQKVDPQSLGFGKVFSDHMYLQSFKEGSWQEGEIVPYQNLPLDPAAAVYHYAQCLFEGQKAYWGVDQKIRLFRPDFHSNRMEAGAARMCMPFPGQEQMHEALSELVLIDSDWIPRQKGCSLYLRPTLFASEPFLGVRPAKEYIYMIIASPVGAYYAEGFNPVRIWVEPHYSRSAPGGLGSVKAGANYAMSLMASDSAKKRGYSQVLWLDPLDKDRIEEVGTMNVFFRFKDHVATPALNGSILNGATRDCVLHLLKKWNIRSEERVVRVSEIKAAQKQGDLLEVFGTGTAAVISSVGTLGFEDQEMKIGDGSTGELSKKLFNAITSIQYGESEDSFGWTKILR
ncbi:MAG: branched-chain amino acid aminotransferase [Oligoflexia bacterium]|nr:branched-chain amino acid aminotransferase [Oligoflexia bacterium]